MGMINWNDTRYDEYATERELEYLKALRAHDGNATVAAKASGASRGSLRVGMKNLEERAARVDRRFHDSDQIPAGYQIKGVSNMMENSLGKPMWVKTEKAALQQQMEMEQAAKAFAADLPRVIPKSFAGPQQDADLIPWFNIGDGHLGMLAHDKEVGENFDLDIAEAELTHALALMIERAPLTDRCVIQDLGDMTHYENYSGTTEASGHALDCDTRFHKMVEVYARTMRSIVEMALTKYQFVDVIINQGNHSRTNDHWMAVMLRAIYENEPRIHVLRNESIFIPYRMGNTLVLCHHTDKCKPDALAAVMANDFAQDWGETKYHYCDGGHVHHSSRTKEINGAIVETFNQLAPMDKYAHDGGWRSRSMLTTVLRSKTYGETGRMVLTAEEVKDRIMQLTPGTTAQKRRVVYTV